MGASIHVGSGCLKTAAVLWAQLGSRRWLRDVLPVSQQGPLWWRPDVLRIILPSPVMWLGCAASSSCLRSRKLARHLSGAPLFPWLQDCLNAISFIGINENLLGHVSSHNRQQSPLHCRLWQSTGCGDVVFWVPITSQEEESSLGREKY